MFSQLRMREEQALLAQDYALEQAEEKGLERGRAEGIEQGLERGKIFTFLDLVRQHVLTSEFASEQLGVTVAEFEALLKDNHQQWTGTSSSQDGILGIKKIQRNQQRRGSQAVVGVFRE